ncbi:MAG: hypothetical protein GYA60_06065 [Candidatus Methanofastidiosa archaeon]|nr:hypothetical protein [Candidatus Methanofastidiosa archaeon]
MRKLIALLVVILFVVTLFASPIAAVQNTPPVLEGGALLYTFESNIFSYKFQVTYKDADGNLPNYLFVFINGSRRAMEKKDIIDNDSRDGIVYVLELSQDELYSIAPKAKEWEIEYWFRTNDGQGVVTTGEMNSFVMDFESMGLIMEGGAGNAPCNCGH